MVVFGQPQEKTVLLADYVYNAKRVILQGVACARGCPAARRPICQQEVPIRAGDAADLRDVVYLQIPHPVGWAVR